MLSGLNAITGTLKYAVASLGFNFRSAVLVLATAVAVYRAYHFLAWVQTHISWHWLQGRNRSQLFIYSKLITNL